MKTVQGKIFVKILVSIIVINSVLGAPEGEHPLKQGDGVDSDGTKVTLDQRVNWGGVFEGSFQVFNGARKIFHAIQEDDTSSSSIDTRRN